MIRKFSLLSLIVCAVFCVAGRAVDSDGGPPAWAYPVPLPGHEAPKDDGSLQHVPGSTVGYNLAQLNDGFFAPDWHPEEHPKMPDVVAHGRKPDIYACGVCHRADGMGGPENASLTGLPYSYIVRQLTEFRSGARSTALPERRPQHLMMGLARHLSDQEIREAALYFSSMKRRQNIRVMETEVVPKTFVATWFLAAQPGRETEAIGGRIIETPEDLEQFENRDTHATFVAYVPPDSVGKGAALAHGERVGKALACVTCHGNDLRGKGDAPPIAGRSPSYVFRQLYDIKSGARHGRIAEQMKEPVSRLSTEDMVNVAAYLASLQP